MDFRVATVDDLEVLISLREQLLIDEGQDSSNTIKDELKGFFTKQLSDDLLVQWLVEDGDTVMATGGVQFISFPPSFQNPSGRRGYILNMYTHPNYRKQGLAKKLLNLCIEEARQRNVYHLFLISSEMGKPVYKKYGFSENDIYMEYFLK
ncbi:GNAT family N-acetyltransferase [Lysinibacillus yapensis]|uniref:GNAT family N-acetyltransferase n=1 Tax=Ureibacillus yapensis TaxID=2304605 RepID=A0A396S5Z5_9BACL|nr:GNAT family N-acetyltransferase [Lysinibacillus yapensis]RHW35003.1 GNAT family N-acetyltransferase [Lysinibacillus yapensis]